MDYYERVSLSDALKRETYKENQYIIKENDSGTWFYMVIEGEVSYNLVEIFI